MIDWDAKEIKMIENHYKTVLNPSINFTYFCRHFEEIYNVLVYDEVLLPDILNDITFYTLNGVNAKYKILLSSKVEEEYNEKLLPSRMKQRAQRQEAHNKGLNEYYKFITDEVREFVDKYPYWNELLQY